MGGGNGDAPDAAAAGAGDDLEGTRTLTGEAVLFGFDSSEVRVRVRPRDRGWRMAGAAQRLGVGLVAAPLLGLVPPHAPWALGAVAAGAILARRRWTETHTLLEVEGSCPRCGEGFRVSTTRLRHPHPLECDGCHHVSSLVVTTEAA